MQRRSGRRLPRRAAAPAVALVVAGLVLAGPAAAAGDDGDLDGNVRVNVSDGVEPAAPPSTPPGPPTRSPGRGSGSFIDTASDAAPDAGGDAAEPPAADEVSLGGVLFVGGLAAGHAPSLDPLAGTLEVWFTVRNASSSTIDASADFWLQGPLGNRISAVDGVDVATLQPGEKRTVRATLPGVGQWTFLSAHVEFTPPSEVDNAELSSFTRETNVFAPPWLIGVLAVAALAAAAVRQIVRWPSPGVERTA